MTSLQICMRMQMLQAGIPRGRVDFAMQRVPGMLTHRDAHCNALTIYQGRSLLAQS